MKKLLKLFAVVFSIIIVLSSCGNKPEGEAVPSPSPESEASAPSENEAVVIDSGIVGQWVPIGVENANGYLQFTSDGNMVKFTIDESGNMDYQELKYYLSSENTFRMIKDGSTESYDFEFEISEDGTELGIYTNSALRIPSKFQRIDNGAVEE